MLKYPEQKSVPLPMPKPADVRIFRVVPMVIWVLDYSKGFGHTDLVSPGPDPLLGRIEKPRIRRRVARLGASVRATDTSLPTPV